MILAAYLAPLAVISPLAGVFVDKWNVKWTMIASDLIRGVLVIALLFVRDLYAIYGIFFLLSTVSSFFCARAIHRYPHAGPSRRPAIGERADDAGHAGVADRQPRHLGPDGGSPGPELLFRLRYLQLFLSAAMVASLPIRRESARR